MQRGLLVAVCVVLSGCTGANPIAGEDGPLEIQAVPCDSALRYDDAAREVLIRDLATFQEWWPTHCDPPTPSLDFDTQVFVAVSTGGHTGYELSIESAKSEAGTIVVEVLETRPGRTCSVAQVITHPVATVAVSRVPGDLSVHYRQEVRDCD